MADPVLGEVWRVNFDPTQGSEMRKVRPAVVINNDRVGRLPLKLVVPITEWSAVYTRYPWMIRLEAEATNGLSKTSGADTFQIRSVSLSRFVGKMGTLPDVQLDAIADAVALCVKAKMKSQD